MPRPLPPNPYDSHADTHIAYSRCIELQDNADEVVQCGRLPVLISARLLGYLILEAPTDEGRTSFVSEVLRCADNGDLQKLAEMYKNHLLRLFRRIKGHTPTPSHHPSAPSFDAKTAAFGPLLAPTPRSHDQAKQQALRRDGYCCLFSGRLDNQSVIDGLVQEDGQTATTVTELAHIFDRSTNEGLDVEKKLSYAASALAVLSRFGQIGVIDELNGAGLHRLENVLTLAADIHRLFDDLQLWLERKPDDPINHYKLSAVRPSLLIGLREHVIFSGTPPPPDPRYLALHAACARVANLSGAGEYIDRILRDIERIGVLANCGDSETLYHALMRSPDLEIEAY